MRNLSFLLLSVVWVACNSNTKNSSEKTEQSEEVIDVKASMIAPNQVPRALKFRGETYEAWRWTDKLGENILVLSTVNPYADNDPSDPEPAQTAELHSFLFVKKDTAYTLRRKLSDVERQCRFDLSTGFIKQSTTVTDLDKDGIAETTVMYKLACRSDVSPAKLKLVMQEDSAKYVLKGLTWLQVNPKDSFKVTEQNVNLETMPKRDDEYDSLIQSMGRYENENDFKSAPPSFLTHARQQWLKFVRENLE